jgi:hypothetical protein
MKKSPRLATSGSASRRKKVVPAGKKAVGSSMTNTRTAARVTRGQPTTRGTTAPRDHAAQPKARQTAQADAAKSAKAIQVLPNGAGFVNYPAGKSVAAPAPESTSQNERHGGPTFSCNDSAIPRDAETDANIFISTTALATNLQIILEWFNERSLHFSLMNELKAAMDRAASARPSQDKTESDKSHWLIALDFGMARPSRSQAADGMTSEGGAFGISAPIRSEVEQNTRRYIEEYFASQERIRRDESPIYNHPATKDQGAGGDESHWLVVCDLGASRSCQLQADKATTEERIFAVSAFICSEMEQNTRRYTEEYFTSPAWIRRNDSTRPTCDTSGRIASGSTRPGDTKFRALELMQPGKAPQIPSPDCRASRSSLNERLNHFDLYTNLTAAEKAILTSYLSADFLLSKPRRCGDQNENVRPAVALWGPAQTGKSLCMATLPGTEPRDTCTGLIGRAGLPVSDSSESGGHLNNCRQIAFALLHSPWPPRAAGGRDCERSPFTKPNQYSVINQALFPEPPSLRKQSAETQLTPDIHPGDGNSELSIADLAGKPATHPRKTMADLSALLEAIYHRAKRSCGLLVQEIRHALVRMFSADDRWGAEPFADDFVLRDLSHFLIAKGVIQRKALRNWIMKTKPSTDNKGRPQGGSRLGQVLVYIKQQGELAAVLHSLADTTSHDDWNGRRVLEGYLAPLVDASRESIIQDEGKLARYGRLAGSAYNLILAPEGCVGIAGQPAQNRAESLIHFVQEIAARQGHGIQFERLQGVEAFAIVTQRGATLFVEQGLGKDRQAWLLLHEIAHLLFAHVAPSKHGLDMSTASKKEIEDFADQEREADEFATMCIAAFDLVVNAKWTGEGASAAKAGPSSPRPAPASPSPAGRMNGTTTSWARSNAPSA